MKVDCTMMTLIEFMAAMPWAGAMRLSIIQNNAGDGIHADVSAVVTDTQGFLNDGSVVPDSDQRECGGWSLCGRLDERHLPRTAERLGQWTARHQVQQRDGSDAWCLGRSGRPSAHELCELSVARERPYAGNARAVRCPRPERPLSETSWLRGKWPLLSEAV
jgi:hypothetical protein